MDAAKASLLLPVLLAIGCASPEGRKASSRPERPSGVKASPSMLAAEPEDFEKLVLRSAVPVLFHFTNDGSGCAPCADSNRVVERVARELKGRVRLVRARWDFGSGWEGIAKKYRIHAIPTLLLFDGGFERARFDGAVSSAEVMRRLESSGPLLNEGRGPARPPGLSVLQ